MIDTYLIQHNNIIGDSEKLYFMSRTVPCVFFVNRKTNELGLLFSTIDDLIYDSIQINEKSIYLFSATQKKYLIYDLQKGEQKIYKISFDNCKMDYNNWAGTCVKLDGFFVFGWQNPVVVVFDYSSGKWKYIDSWKESISETSILSAERCLRSPKIQGNSVVFSIEKTRSLLQIEPQTGKYELLTPDYNSDNGIIMNHTIHDDIVFSLIKESGRLSLFKTSFNDAEKTKQMQKWEADCKDFMFLDLIYANDSLILPPNKGDKSYIYNMSRNEIDLSETIPVVEFDKIVNNLRYNSNYFAGIMIDEEYVMINVWKMEIVIINLKNGIVNTEKIKPQDSMKKCSKLVFNQGVAISEGEDFSLSDWMDYFK